MMVADPQSILAKLGASTPERLVALRCLKNELVGHSQKKEDWVRYGVLRPIVRIIAPEAYEANDEDTRPSFLTLSTFTDGDAAKLQALQLLATFANAGPAFLSPLHAVGALPAVLSSSCLLNEHNTIVLAALRVVRDIAAAAEYASSSSPITPASLADSLFTDHNLEPFYRILSRKPPSVNNDAQTQMIACLIKSLCREERHQSVLVSSGILDALATKLASFIAFNGQVLPRAEMLARSEGLEDYIPAPAISHSSLNGVLGAIASIIGESPYRACKLIYSPSILAILPLADIDLTTNSMAGLKLMELPGIRPTKHMTFQPMDLLLPYNPPQVNNTVIPPSSVLREGQGHNGRSASKYPNSTTPRTQSEDNSASNNDSDGEEAESPLIPLLICAIRSWRTRGGDVLGATAILTSLFKAGLAYKTRESDLGLLIIPIILNILTEADMSSKLSDLNDWGSNVSSRLLPIEEMPAILARLITDSELLQKAAFECNAVKVLCKLLKESCGPPPSLPKSWSWSPHSRSQDTTDELPPECRLGEEGQHRHLVHRINVRQNTLKALGALATYKDDYRKVIVDQEVIPCIVESLTPAPDNPISVVLAACYTVRMLSRSVNILRTTLVDHGVSAPLCQLLRHRDVEVQVAASASVCNLVMDFSPMREPLIEAGVLKALCEHAHSHHASLRLNSLWALKHLVHSASVELKKRTVEELESGWLVRLICDDTEDDALFSAKTRSEREAAQDTLDDMDEDIDMGLAEDQYRTWLSASFYKTPAIRVPSDAQILRRAEGRLENLREAEINPIRKARHDDLAIQEQGLGLIRNLIGGAHSSSNADSPNDTTEMIDFLFSTLGQDRLFEILASKLRVKVLHPFSQRNGTGTETRILPPQTKIIESVIYILVHIAASIPRHRQLVISQTELLKQLAKLFNNQDREVRVALCHLINNLTWQDNANDSHGCSQRASELKKLGFLTKLEALKEGDDELDVRERAKSALWQMKPAF
ncbi:ARM repeat-containing protein [Annulohypoxylon maeteangense]|uniref:ARM repeat-containing protein n=1 Tax=Annulohypoxylon maeteangense TaxID=1927788 RepID=UPI0020072A94|nr:ARM repeat-containing protein [Annulohypoxylon maeteangense]KAI0882477.1 ARM repeat-containing protein [Annulohypoxylon maeteangense]